MLDLSFSNAGRNGYQRAGLSVGSGGIRAYYDRHRYSHQDRHASYGVGGVLGDGGYYDHGHYRYDRYHGYGRGHLGVSLHGIFHAGSYYPYGYVSYYDTYYHRYPYDHVYVYDYDPGWTVYVDRPVVRTIPTYVEVEVPVQTVYVDTSSVQGAPPRIESVGPPLGEVVEGGTEEIAIRVEPQERIPVHNAWLAGGEKEFRSGNYDVARRSFSYAVLEDPEDGFSELAYGLAHFALGGYDAAADAIRRGLGLVPDVIDRPIDVSRQYGGAEDLRSHMGALDSHVVARPDDANAWFVLGYVRFSTGEPESAAIAFSKAASLQPGDPYAAILRDAAARVTVR